MSKNLSSIEEGIQETYWCLKEPALKVRKLVNRSELLICSYKGP